MCTQYNPNFYEDIFTSLLHNTRLNLRTYNWEVKTMGVVLWRLTKTGQDLVHKMKYQIKSMGIYLERQI